MASTTVSAMSSIAEDDKEPDPLTNTMSRRAIGPATELPSNSPAAAGKQHRLSPNVTPVVNNPSRRSRPNVVRRVSWDPSIDKQKQSPKTFSAIPTARETSRLSPPAPTPNPNIANIAFTNIAQSTTTQPDLRHMTASLIAQEHFRQELAMHHASTTSKPDTLVIINDACYGHRYSRRKTTKTNLSLIVERPERIQAVVLGLSYAYVRLGERHTGGKNAPGPRFALNSTIPFAISKSSRSVPLQSQVVTNVHGTEWMQELNIMCNRATSKLEAGEKELARVADLETNAEKAELHEGDLYLCPESLEALQGALGGVLDAVDEVFMVSTDPTGAHLSGYKKAFVCIRPPGHHCSADLPSGFCWLNNVHVGIEHAAQAHGLTHAAIIDFDLHHGDGSQQITWERNDKASAQPKNGPAAKKTSIGYFSLHDINSYPCEWGNQEKVQNASLCIENAHGQSIWNVHLQPWKTEDEFWELYRTRYTVLLDKARAFLRAQTERVRAASGTIQPKGAIFISAGFDASEWEGEGMQRHKVNVPTTFYARFTADINRLAEEEGSGVNGRVISVLEGGYSDRALASGVLSHLTGLVGHNSGGVGHSLAATNMSSTPVLPVHWWHADALTELEYIAKRGEGLQNRKSRVSEPTFHATPTESFLAKVVDPAKVQRAPPTPPLTEVDWPTATFELSKLLIPSERQINSHRADELAVAQPRTKAARQSTIGLPADEPAADGRQLRERKAKAPTGASATGETAIPLRSAMKNGRRSMTAQVTPPANAFSLVIPPAGSTQPTSVTTDASTTTAKMSDDLVRKVSDSKKPIPAEQARGARTRRASGMQVNLNQARNSREGSVATETTQPNTVMPAQSRTRRASGIQTNLNQGSQSRETSAPAEGAPSNTTLTRIPSKTTVDNTAAHDTNMEKLTAGVKRITLRLAPKDSNQTTSAAVSGGPAFPKSLRKTNSVKAPRAPSNPPPAAATGSSPRKAMAALPTALAAATLAHEKAEIVPAFGGLKSEPLTSPNRPTPSRARSTSAADLIQQNLGLQKTTSARSQASVGKSSVTEPQQSPSKPEEASVAIPNSDMSAMASRERSGSVAGRITTSAALHRPLAEYTTEVDEAQPQMAPEGNHAMSPIGVSELQHAEAPTAGLAVASQKSPQTATALPQAAIFVPYEPQPLSTPVKKQLQHAPQPNTLTWLPPNTETPPQLRNKTLPQPTHAQPAQQQQPSRTLPVFTSSSQIPFAGAKADVAPSGNVAAFDSAVEVAGVSPAASGQSFAGAGSAAGPPAAPVKNSPEASRLRKAGIGRPGK